MEIVLSYIANSFVGSNKAYIYILYSKMYHVAYVGETNGECGIISRLHGHTQPGGTFRKQLLDRRGIDLNEISDLHVFSCSLPMEAQYTGVEKAYRRGVEYVVQDKLWEISGELDPYLVIVSNVKYSDTSNLRSVQQLGKEIANAFTWKYKTS